MTPNLLSEALHAELISRSRRYASSARSCPGVCFRSCLQGYPDLEGLALQPASETSPGVAQLHILKASRAKFADGLFTFELLLLKLTTVW